MENKKRITEEDLFKDLNLDMADLFTVNDVFKELTSTRYGFYHVATILMCWYSWSIDYIIHY